MPRPPNLALAALMACLPAAAFAGPSIVVSTWTAADTTTADFNGGAASDVSTAGDRLSLALNNANVDNNGFESYDPNTGQAPGWWFSPWSGGDLMVGNSAGAGDSGMNYAGGSVGWLSAIVEFPPWGSSPPTGPLTFQILDASDAVLNTQSCDPGGSWTPCTFTTSSHAGRSVKFRFSAVGAYMQTATPVICSGSNVTVQTFAGPGEGYCLEFSCFATLYVLIDEVAGGRSTITSGSFTSRTFDTALSSGTWLPSGANLTANGNTIAFQTQSSGDGTTWDAPAAWTPGAAPASAFNRFVRYAASFTAGAGSTGTPFVNDVTLSAGLLGQDIGLRAFDGAAVVTLPVEPDGPVSSPLRIAKDGVVYGVMLVDLSHAQASKLRVQTASGKKAIRRLP